MSAVRELERLERRVLGAIRCIDATTLAPIDDTLQVQAPGARFVRNPSGLYVLTRWTRLDTHETGFDAPPPEPAPGSLTLTVNIHDRRGRYLSRRLTMALPRVADLAAASDPAWLFRPIEVAMYPGPGAAVGANWAAVRVTATDPSTNTALGGALLRVVAAGRVLARGLTDWRGEALVPVAGVPVTTWSTEPDAVVVNEIAASLECVFDPAAGTRIAVADVRDGRVPAALPIVDPQSIEDGRAMLPQTAAPLVLAAGRTVPAAITVAVP